MPSHFHFLHLYSLFLFLVCDPHLLVPSPCLRKSVCWIGCCLILPHLSSHPMLGGPVGLPPPFFTSGGKLKNLRAKKREEKETDHGLTTSPFRHSNASFRSPDFSQWRRHAVKYCRLWRRHGVTSIVADAVTSPELSLGGGECMMCKYPNAQFTITGNGPPISSIGTITGSEKSHFRNCVYHSFFSFSGSGVCSVTIREREALRAP